MEKGAGKSDACSIQNITTLVLDASQNGQGEELLQIGEEVARFQVIVAYWLGEKGRAQYPKAQEGLSSQTQKSKHLQFGKQNMASNG